jgi:hypothetical protein
MGARAYGVVGGAAVVIITLGMGTGTGIGSLGSIDPHGPLIQLPSSNPSPAPVASGTPTPFAQPNIGLVVPHWVYSAITALAAGVALVLIGWFVWRVAQQVQRGRRVAAAAASTEGTEIDEIPMSSFAETVDESLDDLRGGLDTDDVVLECWRRLEALGEHAGAPRPESDTSTEYVERLLEGVPQAATDLAVLARLYRSAMFSGLSSDPSARATAIHCLAHLSAVLSEGASRGA